MVKFRNKLTNEIVEETLIFYIEKLRSNPNFEEVKEEIKELKKDKKVKE